MKWGHSLMFLLLCVSMGTARKEHAFQVDWMEKSRRHWQEMFALRTMADEVAACLDEVDPQSLKEFVPIHPEQLSQNFLTESREWMGEVLCKEANPFLNNVTPSRLCKRKSTEEIAPGKKGSSPLPQTSLVLYTWENGDFHFRLMQSDRGLLLQTRPKKGSFDPDKEMPAKQMSALLQRLIKLDGFVPKDSSIERTFHLPAKVLSGVPFHDGPLANSPREVGDVGGVFVANVAGFLTGDSFYVVIRSEYQLPAPREQERNVSIPDVDRNPRKFYGRWRQMFDLTHLPDEVAICLAYVDPLPDKDFVPFRGEQLSEKFLSWNKDYYTKMFFRQQADPFANQVKPSKYHLSKPGESDLLFYQWEKRDFRFRLMESGRGFLLEARPKEGPFAPEKGVPAEQVAALLNRLVKLDTVNRNAKGERSIAVPKGWTVERAFYLPKQVARGIPFHNMPRHNPWYEKGRPGVQGRSRSLRMGFAAVAAVYRRLPHNRRSVHRDPQMRSHFGSSRYRF